MARLRDWGMILPLPEGEGENPQSEIEMKACHLKSPKSVDDRPLEVTDLPDPKPATDEVLLRISVCGICRTDLHVVEGELPARRTPLIPGHQIVGHVAACGSRVEGFLIGDRVGVAW